MMVLAIIIIVLLLLLLCPVNAKIIYNRKNNDIKVKFRYLFVPYTIYPRKTKVEKRVEETGKSVKKGTEKGFFDALKENEFSDFLDLLKKTASFISETLGKISKHLVIKKLMLCIAVSDGDDAAETAILYGEVCAGVYPLLGIIMGNVGKYKNVSIEIYPDFDGKETKIQAQVHMKMKLLFLLVVGFRTFWNGIKIARTAKEKGYL